MSDLSAQEVATCCRLSWMLMSGSGGPRFAQVRMDTLFVRDMAFWMSLADEMYGKMASMGVQGSRIADLRRANEASNAENAEKRRLRAEAVSVADDVVHAMRHVGRERPEAWRMFEMMIKKQTLRKIVRKTRDRDGASIAADIGWCSSHIVGAVGVSRLELLLTLRQALVH